MACVVSMLIMAIFVSSCAAPVVKGTLFDNALRPGADASSLALRKDEAVVILSMSSIAPDDSWPAACVRDAVASAGSDIRVLTGTDFRDAMFPWFETYNVEQAIEEVKTVPGVTQGIEQIGVRYIIAVGGQTISSAIEKSGVSIHNGEGAGYVGKHGLLLCGPGCLGFMAWQRTSDLRAVVWDLKRGTQVAALAAKVSGTAVMPAFILPIPLIAPTETAVCSELRSQLVRFITAGVVPESPEPEIVEKEAKSSSRPVAKCSSGAVDSLTDCPPYP